MGRKVVIRSRDELISLLLGQLASTEPQNETNNEWRRCSFRHVFRTGATLVPTSDVKKGVFVYDQGKNTSDLVTFKVPIDVKPIYVSIIEISEQGLGFLSQQKLTEDQKITLTIETENLDLEIPATVIHCTQSIGSYKIGVKFDLI